VDIGEIAAPAARDQDLGADCVIVIDQQYAAAALSGDRGAHQSGGAGAEDDRIIGIGARHAAPVAAGGGVG
jgi:hypothetical protein